MQQYKQCGRCGAVSPVTAVHCHACGQAIDPAAGPQFDATTVQPPYGPQPQGQPPYNQPPYGQPQGPQYGQQPQYPQYPQYPQQPQYVQGQFIQMAPGTHNVTLVILLSILIGGWVGMLINKQVIKGVICLVVSILFIVATFGLGVLVTYPLTLIDAILIANRLNRGEVVREWQFF